MILRTSATQLDSYRRLLTEEYMVESELVGAIKGIPCRETDLMQAGTAFHKVLADPIKYLQRHQRTDGMVVSWISCDGFTFDAERTMEAYEYVGPGLCEVKATDVWRTPFGDCTVVAQADHVKGRIIQDHKCKFSTPDARDYERALQWRVYAAVHGADVVQYNLWHFKEPYVDEATIAAMEKYAETAPDGAAQAARLEAAQYRGGFCELKDWQSFRFFPYFGMLAECQWWLNSFLAWADSHKLLPYLNRAGSSVSAA